MLYIWFYATPRPIHKRYRDLCQHLNVKIWPQRFSNLVNAMVARGIADKMARRVLFGIPSDHAVEEQ